MVLAALADTPDAAQAALAHRLTWTRDYAYDEIALARGFSPIGDNGADPDDLDDGPDW